MTKEEFEEYKRQAGRQWRSRTTEAENNWLTDAYERLSPQQKAAMTRYWKQREEDDYYAELESGCR